MLKYIYKKYFREFHKLIYINLIIPMIFIIIMIMFYYAFFFLSSSLTKSSIFLRIYTWPRHHTVTLIRCNAKGEGYNEHRPRKKVHPSYLLQRVTSAGRCPQLPHSHMRSHRVRKAPYGFPWEISQTYRSYAFVTWPFFLFFFSFSLSFISFLFF